MLPDGRLFFAGGGGDNEFRVRATILDPDRVTVDSEGNVTCDGCWITQQDMPDLYPEDSSKNTARFYPTCTTLGDGRILVMGGSSNSSGCPLSEHEGGNTPMIFDATQSIGSQWTVLANAENCPGPGFGPDTSGSPPSWCVDLPACDSVVPWQFHIGYYPFNYLMPDGSIFHFGSNAGPYRDWFPKARHFSIGSESWTEFSDDPHEAKFAGAIMFAPGKFMKAGGQILDSNNQGYITDQAWTIDLYASNPTWSSVPMNSRRRSVQLVTLADGRIMAATGRLTQQNHILKPEVFDPATSTWCEMAAMTQVNDVRGDHSEALLLPDGRVLVSGGEYTAASSNPNNDAQIFSPPYLFDSEGDPAERPAITSVGPVANTLLYGAYADIATPQADDIAAVNLVRLGASTHGFDSEQRFVPLTYRIRTPSGLGDPYVEIDAPANGNEAPPGYYMLFILNTDGVPSVAQMVHLKRTLPTLSAIVEKSPKNRFISFTVPDLPKNPEFAIQVRLASIATPPGPPESEFRFVITFKEDGEAVTNCPDNDSTTYKCATLGCEPEFRPWRTNFGSADIHVTAPEIVPDSTYELQIVWSTSGTEWEWSASSFAVSTAIWGDVSSAPNGNFGLVNVLDIAAMVDKVVQYGEPGIEPRYWLRRDDPNPTTAQINVLDIGYVVEALEGLPYPFEIRTCDSLVQCGAQACENVEDCGFDPCVDGYCVDVFGRCANP